MRKLRTMIGMPVVCGNRRIGRMIQANLSEDLMRLEGIWIGAGLLGTRYVPAERLELLGKVAILSETPGTRRRLRAEPMLYRAVSTDGLRLGAVTGAEIDEVSLSVTALELSAGLWDDLFGGRGRITRYTVNRETGEVIVDAAGTEMEDETHEGKHDQGADHRDADRRIGGDDLRRAELADGAPVEPRREAHGQLDLG